MNKVDFKKTLPSYKAKQNEFNIVDVPRLQYLMIDGHGDPNTSQEFKNAVATLYPLAYKLKFASKIDLQKDYTVMPLEGLWWSDDMNVFTIARNKSEWDWTLMIMQPDWITQHMLENARIKVKQKDLKTNFDAVRLETLQEEKCVQTLHIGSYDSEAEILAKMHDDFIPKHNLEMTHKHHEIYLSDARKVSADKLKTILRQPVKSVK